MQESSCERVHVRPCRPGQAMQESSCEQVHVLSIAGAGLFDGSLWSSAFLSSAHHALLGTGVDVCSTPVFSP